MPRKRYGGKSARNLGRAHKVIIPASHWHINPNSLATEVSERERALRLPGRAIFRATYVNPGKDYRRIKKAGIR